MIELGEYSLLKSIRQQAMYRNKNDFKTNQKLTFSNFFTLISMKDIFSFNR